MAFVCAAVVYNAAAWRLSPLVPGGDEPHYLVIAQSLWRDGDLRIENNHQRGDYLEYFGGTLRPDYLKRGTDNQIYSIHLPGIAALVAPVLAVGGYGAVKVFLALLSAAATAIAWRTTYLVTGSVAAAWFGWAGVALAAPVLLLSFTVYPDGPGGVVVVLAFGLLAALQDAGVAAGIVVGRRRSPGRPVAVVPPAVLPCSQRRSVWCSSCGHCATRGQRARWPRSPSCPPRARSDGSAITTRSTAASIRDCLWPLHADVAPAGRRSGVLGLLFDQQYGLIVYAPVFAMGAAGLVPLARRHRRLAVEWMRGGRAVCARDGHVSHVVGRVQLAGAVHRRDAAAVRPAPCGSVGSRDERGARGRFRPSRSASAPPSR